MQFSFITCGYGDRQYTDKTLTLRKIMNIRASLETLAFSHSKTAISFNILLVLQILCLRNIFQVSKYICIAYISITINAVPLLLLVVWRYKRQYILTKH